MTTEQTDGAMPAAAPRVTKFAFPAFYKAMADRERMQVSRDEATWSESGAPPDHPVDLLLNFGCGVRQTPHLQREAVAVLDALGVEFAAVAGQKYCCGKPYSSNGLNDAAKEIVSGSVQRMEKFQPKRAIQWCSACEMQFKDLVQPDVGIEFGSDGVAEFLVERIGELGDGLQWKAEVPVKVVVHGHLGEHPVRDGHPPIVMNLLRLIPGVEVIGIADSPALDVCDNVGAKIADYGTDEYDAAQAGIKDYLDQAGADALVTMYHACTRELGKFADEELSVRHYISILAEALGVSMPDRFSEYWRLADPAAIVEASRPNWESWGITEREALAMAHKYFVPSYAAQVPECPCSGACSRTGSAWLLPRATAS